MHIRSAAVLLSLAFGAAACGAPPERRPDKSAPVGVTTVAVSEADWPAQFDAGGVIRARTTATIASRLMAPALAVRVRPGDRVRQGQVLIELDATMLGAEAARATAAVTAATEGAAAAAADAQGAESALVLARATHARIAQLHADRAATAQELDQAVAGLSAAESRRTGARARRAEAAATLTAMTEAARGASAGASYRTLTAPFDGVVSERLIDPGSMITPGMPLLVVEATSALQLEVRLDASRANTIALGHTAAIRVDGDTIDTPATEGRVTEIARIDAGGHSFAVKIDLPRNAKWRTGQFGRARFAGAPRRALVVPLSTVIHRGQLSFVFVASPDGRARLRAVSIGEADATRTEVLDGLAAGEFVLISPPVVLTDGAPITATPAGVRR